MNILLIHQYFLEKDDPGGSRFNEMTKFWLHQGVSIAVLAGMVHYASGTKRDRYKGKYILKEHYEANLDVYRCFVSDAYNKNFIGRLWAYFSFVISSIIAGLFKIERKPDVILVTSPPLFVGITAYLLSLYFRVPFIFEVRDLWPESAIDTGVLTNKYLIKFSFFLEKFFYNKAALINVLTPAFRNALIEKKSVSQSKIIYIPNGSDFSLSDHLLGNFDRNKFRKECGFNDKVVITYVGAHGVANHLSQILDTADIIKDEKRVLFVLIGDGMQKKDLIEESRRRNLENVVFIDSVSKQKVFEYILASDFGMSVLKKVDTFKTILSNKTFDYMACKKPIFMLIDGVSRNLVEDAQCGIYVEPENPQDFAAKIKCCLNEGADKWQNQGRNGYEYANKNFDRIKLAEKYYKEIFKLANV